jgi:hypothetical protein
MAKKKRTASDQTTASSSGGSRTDDEMFDRSPATGTAVSTSEEVLAVANDTAQRARREPTYDEIAQRAYQRYLDRGAIDGQDQEDWLTAERELSERRER